MAKKKKLSQEEVHTIIAKMEAAGFSEDLYMGYLRKNFDFPGKYSWKELGSKLGPDTLEAFDPYWGVQKVPTDPVERKKYFKENPPQLGILTEKLGLRIPPAITGLAQLGIGTASKVALAPVRGAAMALGPILPETVQTALGKVRGPYEEVPEHLAQGIDAFLQDPVERVYQAPVQSAVTAGTGVGTVLGAAGKTFGNPTLEKWGKRIEKSFDPPGELMGQGANAILDGIIGSKLGVGRKYKETLHEQMDPEALAVERELGLDYPEPVVTAAPEAVTAFKKSLQKGGVHNRELERLKKLGVELDQREADFKSLLGEDRIGEALQMARENINQFAERELDEIKSMYEGMGLKEMVIPTDYDPFALTRAKIAELSQEGSGPRKLGSEHQQRKTALDSANVQAYVKKEAPPIDPGPGAESWAGVSSRFASDQEGPVSLHGLGQQMTVDDVAGMRGNLKADILAAETELSKQQGSAEYGRPSIGTLKEIDFMAKKDLLNVYSHMLTAEDVPLNDELRGLLGSAHHKMAKMADEMETEAIRTIKNAVDTKFRVEGTDVNGDPIIERYWSAPEAQRSSQVISNLFNDGWKIVQSGPGRGGPGVLETSAMPAMRKLMNEGTGDTWDKMKVNWAYQMFENARDSSGRMGPPDAIQKELDRLGLNQKDIKDRLVQIGGDGAEGMEFANQILKFAKSRSLLSRLDDVATKGTFTFAEATKAIDKKAPRSLSLSDLDQASVPQIRQTIRRLGIYGAASTSNVGLGAAVAISIGLEKYSDLVRNPRKFRMTDEAIEAVRAFPSLVEVTKQFEHLGLLVKPLKVGRIVAQSEKATISREANEAFDQLLRSYTAPKQ